MLHYIASNYIVFHFIIFKDIGLYNESIIDFTKAIKIDPYDYMSYYMNLVRKTEY